MKIAILAHLKHPIAQPFAGGLEMHTHLLAAGLSRRGHDVTLFAAHGTDDKLPVRGVCDPTGEGTGDTEVQKALDGMEEIAYRSMMREVAQGDFDIVHNNSLHSRPLREAGALGIPMTTVLHTPPFKPLMGALRGVGRASTIVAVSASLAIQWAGIVDDVEVIPNGIDLSVFRASRRAAEAAHAFWSGRIVREKGLHLAIDAVRAAGLPLAFAGPRPDATYWKEAIEPRLGPDLTDLGHLAQGDIARHLAQAGVAIVSSCWDEPFGLVIAEALACGTPVAAFARGAIPSLLSPACGALARPDDSTDLAAAIRRAFDCDRSDCRSVAESRFDSETMMDSYERLYHRLVSNARAGSIGACPTYAGDLDEALV